jgi:hypothetical protein
MKKKVVWAVSFRPLGISEENDLIQRRFVRSIRNLRGVDVEIVASQFGELGVKELLEEEFTSNYYYSEFKPPEGHKYSQTTVLGSALDRFIGNTSADYLVWSTCDFTIPSNFFENIGSAVRQEEFCCCILPQQNICDNDMWRKRFMFHFGLDLFVFKLNQSSAEKFKRLNASHLNAGWGCFEHFLSSIPIALGIEMCNLASRVNITKYGNPYADFSETRQSQINEWRGNQSRLLVFLNAQKLSEKFATGSMYYLLWKNTRFKDVGIGLVLTLPHLLMKASKSTLAVIFKSLKSNETEK